MDCGLGIRLEKREKKELTRMGKKMDCDLVCEWTEERERTYKVGKQVGKRTIYCLRLETSILKELTSMGR
jgi:hypothetical protein